MLLIRFSWTVAGFVGRVANGNEQNSIVSKPSCGVTALLGWLGCLVLGLGMVMYPPDVPLLTAYLGTSKAYCRRWYSWDRPIGPYLWWAWMGAALVSGDGWRDKRCRWSHDVVLLPSTQPLNTNCCYQPGLLRGQ